MRLALLGNPRVGKSLIFNQLTGLGVEISNYPGSTVELKGGNICYQQDLIEIIDLPGIYSLEGDSDEEKIVRQFLDEKGADVIISVLDATKLERNLYLHLQVAEYGLPMIMLLNMTDEARGKGYLYDLSILKDAFGLEIIEISAVHGENIDLIIPLAMNSAKQSTIKIPYDHQVEAAIRSLHKMYASGRRDNLEAISCRGENKELLEAASDIVEEIENRHRMTIPQIIAANRHNYAHQLSLKTMSHGSVASSKNPDRYLTRTLPGIPILVSVMLGMLLIVFIVGGFFESLLIEAMQHWIINPFYELNIDPLATTIIGSLLIAIQAGFGIAFPFILLFFIMLSVLEDSGYLSRAAFLADNTMHKLGMHGGGVIPMMMALGCTVPAIMASRILKSRRERMISAFLITLVPCSARTVVISGIVASFVGVLAGLSVYAIVLMLILITGVFLSKVMPGERYGMIMEIETLRVPKPKYVLKKAWAGVKEFLFIAMPLLLVGSIILGLIEYSGWLDVFTDLIDPISMTVLGLPGYATTSLLFGILRKEMAFETLAIMGGTADLGSILSNVQLYVFAVVTVLFIPCLATVSVLIRMQGLKIAAAISGYTIALGILIGAMINYLFK